MTWNWSPKRSEGVWRFGIRGLAPLVGAAPWVTLVLLVIMLYVVGDALAKAKGVLVELPAGDCADGVAKGRVAVFMKTDRGAVVFFDDARYQLGDADSERKLVQDFAESVQHTGDRTLLVLADRGVDCGELMRFASMAREGKLEKVLFAEKRKESEN